MSIQNLLNLAISLVLALCLAACQQTEAPSAEAKPAAKANTQAATKAASKLAATEKAASPSTPDKAEDIRVKQPKLAVETLDGQAFDLSQQRGQFTVVNFWATWCTPCLEEMPDLDDLHTRRADINVIGLAFEETTKEALQTFLTEHPVRYPIAMVDPFEPPADFNTPRGLPMTYVINPDGEAIKKIIGPVTAHELEAIVDGGNTHKQGES